MIQKLKEILFGKRIQGESVMNIELRFNTVYPDRFSKDPIKDYNKTWEYIYTARK
jgi:hypothetical protein